MRIDRIAVLTVLMLIGTAVGGYQAYAQEVAGTPGSPGATTTIETKSNGGIASTILPAGTLLCTRAATKVSGQAMVSCQHHR